MTFKTPLVALTLLAVASFISTPTLSFAQQKKAAPDPALVEGEATLARLNNVDEWTSLFNGKDLSGWTGDTVSYQVEDGTLICPKGAKVLSTEKEYSDFVFHFQFKLQPGGNNGIGIRCPKDDSAAYGGMEIQILDDSDARYVSETTEGKKLTWLKPWQVHGSIYGVLPAKTGYLKPVGEWNDQYIICVDDHIKVVVNGAVVVDAYLDKVTPVDGKEHPGLRRPSGHIQLAGHSDHVEFRNLEIKDFSTSPTMPKTEGDNTPPAGFTALFNGQNLSGWKGLIHKNALERRALEGDAVLEALAKADEVMKAHWSVKDGVLTYDGKGQSLCTAKDYGDFELYVDWKIPPGADSGIYLRGTPQVQIWDPQDTRGEVSSPADWVTNYKNGRNLGSGGLWNNKRWRAFPLVNADKPAGEWNTFLIRMVGEKVSIWLNDKLIVDRVVLENFWDRSQPVFREDQIELQHHGSELFFKNLYIREIPY